MAISHRAVNGSPYWIWPWREPPADALRVLGLLALASTPMLAGQIVGNAIPAGGAGMVVGAGAAMGGSTPSPSAVTDVSPIGVRRQRTRRRFWIAVALTAVSQFLFQLAAMTAITGGLHRAVDIVRSPAATSFFNDAEHLVRDHTSAREFLATFPDRMSHLGGHNQNKPPGPTLYYFLLIRMIGDNDRAALIGATGLALMSSLTTAATAWMILRLTGDRVAALAGAAFVALCPGLTVFFPELDQAYGFITCAALGLWADALNTASAHGGGATRDGGATRGGDSLDRREYSHVLGRALFAAATGVALAVGCFFTHATIILALPLLLLTLLYAWPPRQSELGKAAVAGVIAVGAFALFYALLWLLTGFDAIATFRHVLANQSRNVSALARPWPGTIFWDLVDFSLTSGWLGAPITAMYFIRASNLIRPANPARVGVAGENLPASGLSSPARHDAGGALASRRAGAVGLKNVAVALAALSPIAAVAVTGALQAEAARLWLFLLPLLAIPVGLELSKWTLPMRLTAYACLWFLLAVIVQNIQFIVL